VLPTDPAAAESAVSNNSITGGGIAAIIIVFLLILFICMFFLFRRWQSNKDNKRDIFGHENPAYGEAKKREGDGRDGLFTNQLYSSVMPSEGEYADTQFSDPLYQVPLNPRSGAKVNDTYGNANQRPGVVNNALYADLEGVKSGADDLYMDPVPKANVDSYDENLYSDALPNNTNVLASGANAIAHYDSVRNVRKVNESDNQLYDVAGNNNESYMELDTNANVEQPLYDNTTGTNEQYLMVEQPNKRNSNRDSEYMDVVDGASTLDPNVGDDALYDTAGVTTSEPNRATVNVRPTVDENALYDTAGVTNPVDAAVDEATYDIATTAPTPTPSPRNVLQNAAYTTEEELAPLAEGWAATVDDAGNTYFYNSETQQSTWERPQSTAVRKRSVATRPGNKYWVESTYTQDDV